MRVLTSLVTLTESAYHTLPTEHQSSTCVPALCLAGLASCARLPWDTHHWPVPPSQASLLSTRGSACQPVSLSVSHLVSPLSACQPEPVPLARALACACAYSLAYTSTRVLVSAARRVPAPVQAAALLGAQRGLLDSGAGPLESARGRHAGLPRAVEGPRVPRKSSPRDDWPGLSR